MGQVHQHSSLDKQRRLISHPGGAGQHSEPLRCIRVPRAGWVRNGPPRRPLMD